MRRNSVFRRPADGDCRGECHQPILEPTLLPELIVASAAVRPSNSTKLQQFVRLDGTQMMQKVLWLWKTVGRLARLMS